MRLEFYGGPLDGQMTERDDYRPLEYDQIILLSCPVAGPDGARLVAIYGQMGPSHRAVYLKTNPVPTAKRGDNS